MKTAAQTARWYTTIPIRPSSRRLRRRPAEDALTEAQTVMPTIKVTATVDATYQIMR